MTHSVMHAIIFSGGKITSSPLVLSHIHKAKLIIAADSGAETALKMDSMPHVVIGDFDSLKQPVLQQLKKAGVQLVRFQREKDETDTELALDYAIKHGATEITIVGGNDGNRFDHVIANLFLVLSSPVRVRFVNGNQISWIEKGPVSSSIIGKKGDLLSLIPLNGDVTGVTLTGLQYLLKNETLHFGKPRGVSNVFTRKKAKITCKKGVLLIVYTQV